MNKEKVITSICLSLLFLILFGIIPHKIYKAKHTEVSDIVETNWEKAYPFVNKDNIIQEQKSNNIFKTYLAYIQETKNKIEKTFDENVICKTNFIELNGAISKIINQKYFKGRDKIVNIKDDYLVYIEEKRDTTDIANNLIDFSKYLSKNNIDLLYVQAPDKINKFDKKQSLNGYKNYSNENTDNFIDTVKRANVNVLDLRNEINKQYANEEYNELFYKTDHHWLPTTGIWATKIISNYLNTHYEFNINSKIYEIDNYNKEKYENFMLGSIGKKVTLGYAKPEEFEICYPKFKTNFHVNVPSINIEKSGEFYNTLIYQKYLKEQSHYDTARYWAYGYGDKDIISIDNLNITKGKKILMIKDSFADTVYPYLSIETNKLDIIDLRHFNGSIQTYINENTPDIVIIMYNPSSLVNEENLANTHTNTFDFN